MSAHATAMRQAASAGRMPSLAALRLTAPVSCNPAQHSDSSSSDDDGDVKKPVFNAAAFEIMKQAMLRGKRLQEEPDASSKKARVPSRQSTVSANSGEINILILDFDGTMTVETMVSITNFVGKATSDIKNLFQSMSAEDHVRNFGGADAIEQMKQLFGRLLDIGVELRILSYGLNSNIVLALTQVGLIDYFTEQGKAPGSRVFGMDVPPLNEGDDVYKALAVQGWMDDESLQSDEIAFLDDDRENVDMPERGDDNTGVAQLLANGHARLHTGPFSDSAKWIEDICGLTAPDAGGPSTLF
jgi:hypothetical protein